MPLFHTQIGLWVTKLFGLDVTALCRDCVNHANNKCRIPKVYIIIGQMVSL